MALARDMVASGLLNSFDSFNSARKSANLIYCWERTVAACRLGFSMSRLSFHSRIKGGMKACLCMQLASCAGQKMSLERIEWDCLRLETGDEGIILDLRALEVVSCHEIS